jgi:hypothetical protein
MSSLLPIDKNLSDSVVFVLGTKNATDSASSGAAGWKIEFQFPPKMTSDNRSGTWEEEELPGDQPMQFWKTSGARKMLLSWTYVVGATADWHVWRVRSNIIKLRSYYSAREDLSSNFIVQFKMWKFGGAERMSCRLGNIDVSYGKALCLPTTDQLAASGNSHTDVIKYAHPVITNIKVSMQLWSKGSAPMEDTSKSKFNVKKATKIDIKGLIDPIPIDWQ